MDLLKALGPLLLAGSIAAAQTSPTMMDEDEAEDFKPPAGQKFCQPSDEFKRAVKFLRNDAELSLSDAQVVPVALEIAKGCDGAAKRFGRIFVLLKKSGVDQVQAIKAAMSFVSRTDAQADGFISLFKKIFLENYLNLDFANAFKLSLDLSRDYGGDPQKLKKDFVNLVDYCLSNKGLALDYNSCTEVTLTLVKYTELFPAGVFPEFKKLYDYLRFDKKTGLSAGEALKIAPRIFAKGVNAPANFIAAMKYLNDKGPRPASQQEALETALKVADLSMVPE
jgi:hypothetical protein